MQAMIGRPKGRNKAIAPYGYGSSAVRPNRGPFQSEDQALSEVVRRLVQALDPREIWLFGSRAANRNAPDSDFDLLVVTRAESEEAASDYDAAYAPVKGLGVGCDIIPCGVDEFETERHDPTSLCWAVTHTGRKLYERAATREGVFHVG